MAEDERWWIHDEEGGEKSSKESVEEALNKAETERIQRDKEMEEARHELELARIKSEKKRLGSKDSESDEPEPASEEENGESPRPPMVTGNSGVLGLWWLSAGEATMVAITSVLAIAVAIIWTLGVMGAETYTQTTATIKASDETNWISADAIISGDGTNGTGWFQDDVSGWYEECYTEDDGYEYCNEFWVEEYECYGDLLLSWNISDSEYSGWAYTPSVITPFGCLELMEEYYQIGDVIPIWHVDSHPSEFQTFTVRFGSSSEFGTYWSETMYHWLEWDTLTLMTEYTCEATIAVSYPANVDSVTLVLDSWNDEGAIYTEWSEQSCIESMVESFGDGKSIEVMVVDGDPSKAYMVGATPENFFALTWICCVPIFVLIAISVLVFSRFSNTPPGAYVTNKGVYYHQGYDGDDVTIINNNYGNRWGYGPGRRRRSNFNINIGGSSRRSRSSGGGRSTRGSSGGGSRSSGGGRSGGGSRSSGGGRSGGGRSGGGRR